MAFRTLFLIAILASSLDPSPGFGQKDTSLFDGGDLRAGFSWHPDDLLMSLGAGVRLKASYRLGAEFLFRPSYSPMVYDKGARKLQYREKRYAAMLYAERIFAPEAIAPFEAILGLSGGRSWELRKGFPDRTLAHWRIIPRIGLGYRIKERFLLELEYRYAPQAASNANEHRSGLRAVYQL